MGINFSSLIQGLGATGSAAIDAAQRKKQYEQQALREALTQRLMEAQIGNYQSEADARNRPKPPVPPKYHQHINADGSVDYLPDTPPPNPGDITTPGQNGQQPTTGQQPRIVHVPHAVQPKPKPVVKPPTTQTSVVAQETRLNAQNALAALDAADAALKADDNADIYPATAAGAAGLAKLPLVGSALSGFSGTLEQSQLTPSQKMYQQAMDQFLHNYSAVMAKGGRSVSLLQNLRNSFTPRAGQTEKPVRESYRRARAGLRRQLQILANGQDPGPLPDPTPTETPATPGVTPTQPTSPRVQVKDWSRYQ